MIEPISPEELEWAKQARAQHPEITSYGFGLPANDKDHFEESGDSGLQMIVACRRWLIGQKFRKTINPTDCPGSYAAKHMVESWPGNPKKPTKYIYEGALILAAVALGVPYKQKTGNWGIYLGLSRKTIPTSSFPNA